MPTPINTGTITGNRGTALDYGKAIGPNLLGSFILGESQLGDDGPSISTALLTTPKINATDPIRR